MSESSRRRKTGVSFLELENLELKAKTESQELLISQLREQIRATRVSNQTCDESVGVRREQELLELQGIVRSQDLVVKQLQEELSRNHQNMEQVHMQCAGARGVLDAKDATITGLRREIDTLHGTLETAQNDRLQTLDRLNSLKVELSSVNVDKNWLEGQLNFLKESADVDNKSRVSQSYGSVINQRQSLISRMEGVKKEREALEELISTASHYEEMIRSFDSNCESERENGAGERRRDYESYRGASSPGRHSYGEESKVDEKVILEMGSKMNEVEERLKKAVLSQKYQLQVEREQLIQEFKNMQKQLLEHQKHQEMQKNDIAAKDTLVQRLKSVKASLESEVESLKRELAACQAENNRFVQEHRDVHFELSSSRNRITKLEADLENEKKQRALLRRKLEEIGSHSSEERDALSQIKIQVREQNLLSERYQKDLVAKENLITQLRERLEMAEAELEGLGRERAAVQASRTEFAQQREDLNKKLSRSEKRVSELEKLYEDCRGKKAVLQKEVQSYQWKFSRLEATEESEQQKRSELENELAVARKKITKLEAACETSQQEKLQLQQNLLPATMKVAQLKHACESYQQDKSTLHEDSLYLHKKISELEVKLERHKQEKGELQRELRAGENKVSRVEQQLQRSLKEKQELGKKLQEAMTRLHSATSDSRRLEDNRQDYQKKFDSASSEVYKRDKVLHDLQAEKHSLEGETQRLKHDFEAITNDLRSCQGEKEKTQKELAIQQQKVSDTEVNYTRLQTERDKLEQELVSMKCSNTQWKEMCDKIQQDKERLQEELLVAHRNISRYDRDSLSLALNTLFLSFSLLCLLLCP